MKKLLLNIFTDDKMIKNKISFSVILLILLFSVNIKAQCTAGKIYASGGTPFQQLVEVNTSTGVTTQIVANLFGGGTANTDAQKETTAIALDLFTNTIWFCNRGTSSAPKIYSYNITSGTYGATSALFLNGAGIIAVNSVSLTNVVATGDPSK